MEKGFLETIFLWQDLVGAIIGAATPLFFWLFIELYRNYKKHRDDLYYLEKLLVLTINNLIDSRKTIKHFIDVRLVSLQKQIDEESAHGRYCVSMAFLPLFVIHSFDESALELKIKSGYIDNQLNRIVALSKDYVIAIDDLREQYKQTYLIQKEIAFSKLNPAVPQNNSYKANIEEFRKIVKEAIFEKNMKAYIKLLVTTREAVNFIRRKHIFLWKLKFTASFKYFRNKKQFKDYKENLVIEIENFLKEDIEKGIAEIEALY